ncbi:MAG TPA: choice-of-anchor tandem repeat GloVer-containing protein [Terriglobales bacterium]|nr:choice-of-anchor tandem repeat GloVer-containing protein [Terriglobales bacterium]
MFRASSKRPRSRVLRTTIAVSIYLSAFAALASGQWNESVLYSFQGGTDGEYPLGRTVFDSVGNLYGITTSGGASSCWGNCGTVYELTPPIERGGVWTESVLHVFLGHPGDGNWPQGGLVTDSNGNLYGSTGYGGTGSCEVLGTYPGCGTVYEMSPPTRKGGSWTETILYDFQGGNDGFVPFGDLVIDNAGNLYGATLYGGGRGKNCGDGFYQYCGTIYELSPPRMNGGAWTEQVLYSFTGIPVGAAVGDGANPNGGLVLDNTGSIYGTTQIGGVAGSVVPGWGTVFKLTPPSKGNQWTETVMYRFLGGSDGRTPTGSLTSDPEGNLYTVTQLGGENLQQEGTVSELARKNNGQWVHYILHSFSGGDDGGEPESGVAFDSEGNLYGDATYGGAAVHGTLYEIHLMLTGNPSFEVVYNFGGPPNGSFPISSITFDSFGDMYGTTGYGGTGANCTVFPGCGTVFQESR